MKPKKPTSAKKDEIKDEDSLLDTALPAEEIEEETEGSDDMPVDIVALAGDDVEELDGDDLLAVAGEKEEDEAPIDPMSMSEFGVETEETADPLSSEEKRYFMGEDESEEDEEQAMIDDSFTPEDYEQ